MLNAYSEVPLWLRGRRGGGGAESGPGGAAGGKLPLNAARGLTPEQRLDLMERRLEHERETRPGLTAQIEAVIARAVDERIAADRAVAAFEAAEAMGAEFEDDDAPVGRLASPKAAAIRRMELERAASIASRLRVIRQEETAADDAAAQAAAERSTRGAGDGNGMWVLLRATHSWEGAGADWSSDASDGDASMLLPLRRGEHILALRARRHGEWWWGKAIVDGAAGADGSGAAEGWFPASFVTERKRAAPAAAQGRKAKPKPTPKTLKNTTRATSASAATPRYMRLRVLYDWDGAGKASSLALRRGATVYGLRSCCGAPPSDADEGWWWWGGLTTAFEGGGWFPARYVAIPDCMYRYILCESY